MKYKQLYFKDLEQILEAYIAVYFMDYYHIAIKLRTDPNINLLPKMQQELYDQTQAN